MKKIKRKDVLIFIEKLIKNKLLTNSKTHNTVLENYKKKKPNAVNFILTHGIPQKALKCRECGKMLPANQFSYYQTRVESKGYLMRSNALCKSCQKQTNKRRQEVFDKDKDKIPPRPETPVTSVPVCNRVWEGTWHRHHDPDTHKFLDWRCGNCNMSRQDQRNPDNYKKK